MEKCGNVTRAALQILRTSQSRKVNLFIDFHRNFTRNCIGFMNISKVEKRNIVFFAFGSFSSSFFFFLTTDNRQRAYKTTKIWFFPFHSWPLNFRRAALNIASSKLHRSVDFYDKLPDCASRNLSTRVSSCLYVET